MKNLLKFMAGALALSIGLTACDNSEDPHEPYKSGYNPQGSYLNTSHSLVGEMYSSETGVTTNPEEAEGIVFAVSQDGRVAYLVSFTDAMVVGAYRQGDDWSFLGGEGYCALQSQWGLVTPSDTGNKSAVIHDVDGETNTNNILKTFQDLITNDTTKKLPTVYAAKLCRDYYRREWSDKRDDGTGANNDKLGPKWKHTQGQWYLPSIEELGDLMKNKDKINKKYGNEDSDFIQKNGYYFMKIGGAEGHAYWSSSEFNVQAAWYCLPDEVKGKEKDGVYPGNKRYGYFQKNDKINMYVRPIRKALVR